MKRNLEEERVGDEEEDEEKGDEGREKEREREARAERRGKFHRTRRPWRAVRTEGTKTYDDKKKSMRRARKFYGILESWRQVVRGDDYKRDTGKEVETERKRNEGIKGGWNVSR